jgi:hypothetical protein
MFGYSSIGLIFLIDYDIFANINEYYYFLPIIGFSIELLLGFIANLISYGLLANKWEGYHEHKFLQVFHYFSLCFFSLLIPHGDFLLHMGYNHKGINYNGAIEEPFPSDFEIPKVNRGY